MSDELSDIDVALTYVQNEPNISALQYAYDKAKLDQEQYIESCERAYNDRRNMWPGKSGDMRKSGANAFPWDGASDMEVNIVGERIDTYVALLTQALDRSHIKAFPTSHASMAKASVVSMFLKWMRKSYIPDFKKQMELGANHLLEKGIMVSYVGWKREKRTFKQVVRLQEIEAAMPELVEILLGDDIAEAEAFVAEQIRNEKSKVAAKNATITCVKGKAKKKVTGMNPVCPSGFKKK
jgi:hypothetical protein